MLLSICSCIIESWLGIGHVTLELQWALQPQLCVCRGVSSTVRRCIEKSTGRQYAVKIFEITDSECPDDGPASVAVDEEIEELRKSTMKEVDILKVCAGQPHISKSADCSLFSVFLGDIPEKFEYNTRTALAGAPRTVTDKLQRVLNAAARVVTGTWKFDHGLGHIPQWRNWLAWYPWPGVFQAGSDSYQRLNGCAPPYLSDYCVPAAGVDTRQHLRSAKLANVNYLQYLATGSTLRAVGPFHLLAPKSGSWNCLPDFIRDPTIIADCFRRLLKT